MTPGTEDDFASRRDALVAQIAAQRKELADSYARLEKPIRYAEYGIKGFNFARQNSWLFVVVPTAFNLAFSVYNWTRRGRTKPAPAAAPAPAKPVEKASRSLLVWAERAWQLFDLYRRVRPLVL